MDIQYKENYSLSKFVAYEAGDYVVGNGKKIYHLWHIGIH